MLHTESVSMMKHAEKVIAQSGNFPVLTQYWASIIASFGCVCAGTVLAWTSPVLPQIFQDQNHHSNITTNATSAASLHLTETESGLVGSLACIGAIFGAIPAGYLSRILGLKRTLILLSIPFSVNWSLLISENTTLPVMFVARFLGGISTGAICVCVPMYINAIASVHIRGTLGTLFQVSLCLGILVVNVIGSLMKWTDLSIAMLLISVIYKAALLLLPEIVNREDTTATKQKTNICGILGQKNNLRSLKIGLGLVMFQQLSGVNGVIFYTATIFQETGSDLSPSLSTILVALTQLIVVCISIYFIEKKGRRFYLMVSSTGMTLSLALMASYFWWKNVLSPYVPLVALVVFILSFSVGFGPIPWLMLGEIFSGEMKAFGFSLVTIFNWSLVFVVTLSFPQMTQQFGEAVPFAVFGVFCLLSAVFVLFLVPETRGRTSNQIQDELSR